jgi:putative transcriptional regulator
MHWTYPVPLRMAGSRNVYTLHDLVPLKLPHTTLDDKRHYHRLIETLQSFDATCLPATPALAAEEIRALRERERVSQPVFAAHLNVSRNLVSDWERGVKRPGRPALRLLSIVQRKGLQALALIPPNQVGWTRLDSPELSTRERNEPA